MTLVYSTPKHFLTVEFACHTAFSKKLGRVVMMSEAEDHLAGTKVRQMLGEGIAPPPEFSRPEAAQILTDFYQKKKD